MKVAEQLLRIQRISLEGLYGLYDHQVALNADDRVTIIHGPNGVGKTTLLRLVQSFMDGNYLAIVKVPFDRFVIELDNQVCLGIRRALTSAEQFVLMDSDELEFEPAPSKKEVLFEFFSKEAEQPEKFHPITTDKFDISRLLRHIDSEFSWITRIGKNQWVDRRTEEMFTSEQLISTYGDQLPARLKKRFVIEPEWIKTTREKVKVHLIETQRLLRFGPSRVRDWRYGPNTETVVSTVKNYAVDLQQRIADALASYAKTSQSLDQSFPQRLLSGNMKGIGVEELKIRMEDLEKKRVDLKRIGLLDEDATYPFDVTKLESLNPTQNAVMTLYVEDTQRKLGVLDELSQRTTLLLDNVNKKFRHKRIDIEKSKGLVAVDTHDRPLDLDALSSGEQHELVLIYDLLFRVVPNTLVLIDEPELSLHLNWQKSFLADLLKIVRTANFDVLLATHSPFIAGDRHDLMIALSNEVSEG